MKLDVTEAALTSPGRALSERARWENALTSLLDRYMLDFLDDVLETVLSTREVNTVQVHDMYQQTITDVLAEIDTNDDALAVLEETLRNDAFADEVFNTAEYLLSETQQLNLSDAELRDMLTAGLDYDQPSIVDEASLEDTLQASAVPRIIGQVLARSTGRGKRWRKRTQETSRTAATASLNETQNQVIQRSSLTHKQWITRRDDRVRATHADADGQIVPKASLFQVGSASLAYPGQGSFPPEEVINCRCVMIAVRADGKTF